MVKMSAAMLWKKEYNNYNIYNIYTCEDDLSDSVHLYSNGHNQENGVGDVCLQPSVFK